MQTPVLAMIVRRDDEIRTLQARAVLGAADPLPRGHLQVRRRPLRRRRRRPGRSCERVQGHPFVDPGRRAQAGAGPAAAALRPDRAPAGHEPAVRPVGRRHAQGGAVALRGQADQLPEDRLALPGRRHEGEDPRHPGRPPAAQAGRDRQARPRRPRLHRRGSSTTRRSSDHHAIIPTGKRPGTLAAGGPEGLRRRRHPPDRRLLPRLREGGDDRRRGVERGAVPGQGRAGARAGLDGPVPPASPTTRRRTSRSCPSSAPARAARTSRPSGEGETTPPKPYTEGTPARGDGDGRQAGRRRAAQGGAQGARAWARRRRGPRSSRPCWRGATSRGRRRRWPRRTWAATSWRWSRTGA